MITNSDWKLVDSVDFIICLKEITNLNVLVIITFITYHI